ncbi:hypothetical protein [Clostridium weizhouense]|uniref:DUF304 domain-containing protein n=1 Tax=Clostridium weizhouense TaxID=2859781 RepID=A0ABS7ATC8_9CLOT|nr:hypothetical protein [Clostridium weizhouense]MBW6411938.1 hypothetical protein [Clostridium weizhouense]
MIYIEELFKRYLLIEEKVLWSGKPDTKNLFMKEDIFPTIFGCSFIIAHLIWEVISIRIITGSIIQESVKPSDGIISALFGLPFIFIGYYLTIGRVIKRKLNKQKILYAITNKRLLIFEIGKTEKVIAKYINQITNIDIDINKNGRGTIIFGENKSYNKFYDLYDSKNVYELLNSLISQL